MLGTTLALNRSTAGLRLSKLHLCSVCDVVISIKAKDGGGGKWESRKTLFAISQVPVYHQACLESAQHASPVRE